MIKVNKRYTQYKNSIDINGVNRGTIGQIVEVFFVGKRGLQFVNFKIVDTGKIVIGQYTASNFLEYFKELS